MLKSNRPKLVGVTGVCGGLGKEFLKQFSRMGARVIGIDINSEELDKLQDEYKDNFSGYVVDLKNHSKTTELLKKIVDKEGTPDLWINSAGVVNLKSFREETVSEFNKVIQINLNSVATNCSFWVEEMEKNGGGKIVNISSVAGFIPSPMLSSYCASKYAVVGLTECLQQELRMRKSSVQVLLVCPGFINTQMIKMGQDRGLTEKLKPFISDSEKSVKIIVEKILEGKEFIDPTINGRLLKLFGQYSPNLFKKVQLLAMPDHIKKIMLKK